MKNRKNLLGILAMALVFGALLIGCSKSNPLIGTWSGSTMGTESEITFGRDGSYTEKTGGMSVSGTYSVDGGKCSITVEGVGTIDYDFVVNGKELTYTFMGIPFTFTKK